MQVHLKGRGAQERVHNKFASEKHEWLDDFLEYCSKEEEAFEPNKTRYLTVYPKSFVNPVNSPDVGMEFSANPYQGCEHGCVYCYARNSHEYWGYGAGLDFERVIMVKKNAPELLIKKLKSKKWEPTPIVFSGNTDCYQPAEKKFELTRRCLQVLLDWKHPVGIITKNSLVLRDLDLLKALADQDLVQVVISITSLSEKTRRLLEPRTATIKKRLQTVETLAKNNIPVMVMMAPIIPSLNSHEILPLAKTVADAGAMRIGHTIVRLNGQLEQIFSAWLKAAMPDRAERILNQIADCHGGQVNSSEFGLRMRGQGAIAQQINDLIALAKKQYFPSAEKPKLRTDLFSNPYQNQLKLF